MKAKNIKSTKGGYQVSIMRQGTVREKTFNAADYCGSYSKAFAEAKAFRDAAIKEMPRSCVELGVHTKCRSNTGHVGVTETSTVTRRGVAYQCFTVSARPRRGVIRNRKIYFTSSTRAHALTEAVAWRTKVLAPR
jgi:hypothetical protein